MSDQDSSWLNTLYNATPLSVNPPALTLSAGFRTKIIPRQIIKRNIRIKTIAIITDIITIIITTADKLRLSNIVGSLVVVVVSVA